MLQVYQACQRKTFLIRRGQPQGQGDWPILEAYWPDPTYPGMLRRNPHPTIAYKPVNSDPYIPPNFIFDKYERFLILFVVPFVAEHTGQLEISTAPLL